MISPLDGGIGAQARRVMACSRPKVGGTMRNANVVVCAILLGVLWTGCGDDEDGDGNGSESCTVSQTTTAVTLTCGSSVSVIPISGRLPDGGIVGCATERTASGVSITCSDGSRVTVPTSALDGGLVMCAVTDRADGTIAINCPDGTMATVPGTGPTGPTGTGSYLIGATTASCGTCHDSTSALAHFSVMTVHVDAGPIETCETCHAEGSIMPVTRAHARLEYAPPGLKVALSNVRIDATTRKPTVRVQLATLDDAGATPLDRTGMSLSFTLAKITSITPASGGGTIPGPYVSYITRTATQQNTPSFPIPEGTPPRVVQQPTAENSTSGKFTTLATGDYDYTFNAALPANYDPTAGHIIAVYATRTVAGVRYVGNATVAFVPASGATPPIHDIVRNQTCNGCHNPLQAHGGSRQDLQLCLTCHSQEDANAVDPESNNSIAFNVMLHKIHMGKRLPSVGAGKPYIIIGNSLSVHDWSHAGFPQPIENCQSCHTASDSERWVTNASRNACLACHEFAGDPDAMAKGAHPFNLQPEAVCGACHSIGGAARDAREAHVVSLNTPTAPVFSVEIVSITVATPDDKPVVRFRALTGTRATPPSVSDAGTPLTGAAVTAVEAFSILEAHINGPNTGFALDGRTFIRLQKAMLTDLAAVAGTQGEFTFTLPMTLRQLVGTTGDPESDSYTLALKAQYDPTPTGTPDNDRVDSLRSPLKEFGAGETVVARKLIAEAAKCNACHGDLTFHGGAFLTHNVEACAMCHTATHDTRVSQAANKVPGPTTSLRLSTMVHRIHGASIAERPYKVFGYAPMPPYPVLDFSEIGFPGDARDCTRCHFTTPAPGTYTLPLPEGNPPTRVLVLDADGGVVGQ